MDMVLVSPVVAWVCYWIMLVTVLCWEMFETRGIGCTVLLLTKVCTLAFKIS